MPDPNRTKIRRVTDFLIDREMAASFTEIAKVAEVSPSYLSNLRSRSDGMHALGDETTEEVLDRLALRYHIDPQAILNGDKEAAVAVQEEEGPPVEEEPEAPEEPVAVKEETRPVEPERTKPVPVQEVSIGNTLTAVRYSDGHWKLTLVTTDTSIVAKLARHAVHENTRRTRWEEAKG